MSAPDNSNAQPQEMTPEAAAAIKRVRRHFAFSIGIFVVGFMVLGGALVYRSTRSGGEAAPAAQPYAAQVLRLPQGAELVSASAAEGRISVTYRQGGALQMRIFDGASGQMIQQLDIVTE